MKFIKYIDGFSYAFGEEGASPTPKALHLFFFIEKNIVNENIDQFCVKV